MPLSRRLARFNRRFANHLAGPVFTRLPEFGAVHHRGRKSGKEYATPVRFFRGGEDYVIALPYGSGADWVRNVLAAGGCDVSSGGTRTRLDRPRVIRDDKLPAVPAMTRWVLSRVGCTEVIVLSPAAQEAGKHAPTEGKPVNVPDG